MVALAHRAPDVGGKARSGVIEAVSAVAARVDLTGRERLSAAVTAAAPAVLPRAALVLRQRTTRQVRLRMDRARCDLPMVNALAPCLRDRSARVACSPDTRPCAVGADDQAATGLSPLSGEA